MGKLLTNEVLQRLVIAIYKASNDNKENKQVLFKYVAYILYINHYELILTDKLMFLLNISQHPQLDEETYECSLRKINKMPQHTIIEFKATVYDTLYKGFNK